MVDVAVVDYGMGNLRSVEQALRKVAPGAGIEVSDDAKVIADAGRVVFPGQGAMPDCMRELDARGLRDVVLEAARSKPFLGICIGLQMLFEHSAEGNVAGLGVLRGEVLRFAGGMRDARGNKLKVPHMGWNQVHQTKPRPEGEDTSAPSPACGGRLGRGSTLSSPNSRPEGEDTFAPPPSGGKLDGGPGGRHPLWDGIDQDARFYFVHSYYVQPRDASLVQATSNYPQPFVCAVARDNLFAVQFHPEKSHAAGLKLLQNFVQWNP